MSLLSFLGISRSTALRSTQADTDRLAGYTRYKRAYRGFRSGLYDTNATTAQKSEAARKVRFNFNRPIVNLGAAFLAGKPVRWSIGKEGKEDKAATKAANDIWDRSGSDRAFLKAARCAGIYGEVVGLAVKDEQERARIEFVSPDICFPTFDGRDASRMVALDITWREENREGRQITRREFYTETGREVYEDDREVVEERQAWDALPAAWIRNLAVEGESYGISDLEGVVDLVEEYDHLCAKRGRALDYYATPTIVVKGHRPGSLNKDMRTILYLDKDADAFFLEWQGTAPDYEQQLTRIRNDLTEISQVPAVAFGRQDSGFSAISGIALKLLYGPLLAKTNDKRANQGPPLEYLMWLALQADGVTTDLESVNTVWPDPLPEDDQMKAEGEATAVREGLRSRLTAIGRLGAENPKQELQQIDAEQRVERLAELVDAGASLGAAAELAGFSEEEAETLLRSDFIEPDLDRRDLDGRDDAEEEADEEATLPPRRRAPARA